MKKLHSVLFVVLFIVSASAGSFGQDSGNVKQSPGSYGKKNFWYGPKFGFDLSTPAITQSEIRTQLKSNNQIGFFFQAGNRIYFQPEFYYATLHEERLFRASNLMEENTVNYIKIPVLLGVKIIGLGFVSLHAMAGPMGSFLLSESNKDPGSIKSDSEYRLLMGGGIDVFRFITLDLRYSVNLDQNVKDEINHLTWDSPINVTMGIKIR